MDSKDITVLLPTRGRTTSLATCVFSLLDKAEHPDQIEILLAFDDDDHASRQYFLDHVSDGITKAGASYTAFEFPRLGYIRLNEYINVLGRKAQGHWLMFWSDDAVMVSSRWDRAIRSVDRFRVLRIPTHNHHPYAIFPIVPRAWVELFGYVSAHQLTDSWVSQIAYMLDIMHNIDVEVIHDRADLTGNNRDETWNNRPYLEGNPQDPRDFNHVNWRQHRYADAAKLRNFLADNAEDVTWFDLVSQGKQDPWAKMCSPEYDPNKQLARYD